MTINPEQPNFNKPNYRSYVGPPERYDFMGSSQFRLLTSLGLRSNHKLLGVLDELDNELASIGGKIYLAKDLRQKPEVFKKTYRSYQSWKSIKKEMDPDNLFKSDLSIRLKM